ncbi:MAG TPA: TfoX/Sxy family protein [Steroidobacteraceae bacterium]|nr:TfoX/Sxy family protein [Steroidobacteraceae bacterium]
MSKAFVSYVLEQLGGLPRVSARRMFGGIGLYCDGQFFGLIHHDTVFFNVNDTNREDYVARNMPAFRPYRDRPELSMSYFAVPVDALEDRDELTVWARKSVAAAASSAKPRKRRNKSPHKS